MFLIPEQLLISTLAADRTDSFDGSSFMARAMPYTAKTIATEGPVPILVLIALITCSKEDNLTTSKSFGRRFWSIIFTDQPSCEHQTVR